MIPGGVEENGEGARKRGAGVCNLYFFIISSSSSISFSVNEF